MSSTRNLLAILALAIVLPILVFTGMELSTLNEDEEILQEIYVQQIDAVIFSVNQYSEDFTRSYVNEISGEWTRSKGERLLSDQLRLVNLAIVGAVVHDSSLRIELFEQEKAQSLLEYRLDSTFQAHQTTIRRLITYKEANYTKLEPIGRLAMPDGSEVHLILTIIGIDTPMILLMDATAFLEDLMKPRLQQIAGSNLVISVCEQVSEEEIIATDTANAPVIQAAGLWLLPDLEVRVGKTGETLDELLQYRRSRNLTALGLLTLALLLGVFLMFRASRREALAAKAKSDFVANVSHEIRTPLSLISMFNETLLSGKITSEEKRREYYTIIDQETHRLNTIVNKILSFSKLDAGKRRFDFVKITPDEEVARTFDGYRHQLQRDGFEFQLLLNASDAKILADREAFSEAFVNLLDNAMKYSMEHRHLTVVSHLADKEYVVSVQDKGIGIPSGHLPFIFDKFYRVKGDKDYSVRGTGLGLALVKSIMEVHRGRVSVTSEEGKGSTFSLHFPIEDNGQDINRG